MTDWNFTYIFVLSPFKILLVMGGTWSPLTDLSPQRTCRSWDFKEAGWNTEETQHFLGWELFKERPHTCGSLAVELLKRILLPHNQWNGEMQPSRKPKANLAPLDVAVTDTHHSAGSALTGSTWGSLGKALSLSLCSEEYILVPGNWV